MEAVAMRDSSESFAPRRTTVAVRNAGIRAGSPRLLPPPTDAPDGRSHDQFRFDLDPRSRRALLWPRRRRNRKAAAEVVAHGEPANENRKLHSRIRQLFGATGSDELAATREPSAVNALCKPLSARPIKKSPTSSTSTSFYGRSRAGRLESIPRATTRAIVLRGQGRALGTPTAIAERGGLVLQKPLGITLIRKARECLEQQQPRMRRSPRQSLSMPSAA